MRQPRLYVTALATRHQQAGSGSHIGCNRQPHVNAGDTDDLVYYIEAEDIDESGYVPHTDVVQFVYHVAHHDVVQFVHHDLSALCLETERVANSAIPLVNERKRAFKCADVSDEPAVQLRATPIQYAGRLQRWFYYPVWHYRYANPCIVGNDDKNW